MIRRQIGDGKLQQRLVCVWLYCVMVISYKASRDVEGQEGHDHAEGGDGQDGVALGEGEEGEAEGGAAAADGVVQLPLRLDVHQLDLDDSLGGVADGEDEEEVDQVRQGREVANLGKFEHRVLQVFCWYIYYYSYN